MDTNAVEYKPTRGAFAAVAKFRGVKRQYISREYNNGNPEIVTAVIEYDVAKAAERRKAMIDLTERLTATLKADR